MSSVTSLSPNRERAAEERNFLRTEILFSKVAGAEKAPRRKADAHLYNLNEA
jgi:hypothetical protein